MDLVEIGAWGTIIGSVIVLVFLGIKGYNLIFKDK